MGNTYHSVVMQKGNPVAQAMMKEVYDLCDDAWRGIGIIPNSGLALKMSMPLMMRSVRYH